VNLMSRATFRNGVSNYFYYDALNRRRAIKESTGASYFVYDKDGLCLLVERNAAGSVTGAYTRGCAPVDGIGDLVVSQINTATTTYYRYPVFDQPGKLLRTVSAAGVVSGSFEYNALGEKLLNQPPAEGTRFGMSAPAWMMLKDDPDGVVVASPSRAYYNAVGIWLSRDPKGGLPGSYRYAVGNPLSFADANGRAASSLAEAEAEYGGPLPSYMASIFQARSAVLAPDLRNVVPNRYRNIACRQGTGAAVIIALNDLTGATGILNAIYGFDIDDLHLLSNGERWKEALLGALQVGLMSVAGASMLNEAIGPEASQELTRFFYDPRAFSGKPWENAAEFVSDSYWEGSPANGNALHHWLIPQSAEWVPQGIRNAGFNLVVTSQKFRGHHTQLEE